MSLTTMYFTAAVMISITIVTTLWDEGDEHLVAILGFALIPPAVAMLLYALVMAIAQDGPK